MTGDTTTGVADDPAPGEKGTAVVTGATRGIGYELARLFAGTGHDVTLVARTETDLEETATHLGERFGVDTQAVALDLTDPDAADRLRAATADRDVTALVNNAGVGTAGRFDESDPEEERTVLDLKVRAVTDLTKRFLPALREGPRRGRVLTVASASAFVPGPRMAVYYAANAYALSFSESLAAEFADEDLGVTCLCPGPVDTDFHATAGTDDRPGFVSTLTPTMDARSVARAGFRGLRRGETVVVPGLTMRLFVALARVTPRPLLRRAMRHYNDGL